MKSFLILFISVITIPIISCSQNQKSINGENIEKVKWLSFEEAIKLNEKNPKKIFIDVYTDWCGWCKKMDAATFSHPEIVKYLNERFYSVKLDAEMKETIIVGGQTFKNPNPDQKRSTHEIAIALLNGKMGYPTVVFLDEKINMITPVPGYQTPEAFEPILYFIATGAYVDQSFDNFQQAFKGKIKN